VSDARQTCTGISGAEGFEPALKMKAEGHSLTEDVIKMLFAENLL
jgi:hypothetical protein